MSELTIPHCRDCGAEIRLVASQARIQGRGQFCSRACQSSYKRSHAEDPDSIARRFWSHLDKNGPLPADNPELGHCWVWRLRSGALGRYPKMNIAGRTIYITKVAWFLEYGRWPDMWMLHKCDGGLIGCARHDHLFEGTPADNTADMMAKGRYRPIDPSKRRARLTPEIVLEIKSRAAAGEAPKDIIARFGLTTEQFIALRQPRAWKRLVVHSSPACEPSSPAKGSTSASSK